MTKKKDWPLGILEAIGDSLAAHLTLQARCGLAPAYSEYLLYDPIVRVCRYREWNVECEVALPKSTKMRGDSKRIDFRLRKTRTAKRALLLEVKYRKSAKGRVNVGKDIDKLKKMLQQEGQGSRAFLLVAGRELRLSKGRTGGFDLTPGIGEPCYTTTYKAAHTTFGVAVYEVPERHDS